MPNSKPELGKSLLDLCPTLCEEWDNQRNNMPPQFYRPYSSKSVWWKCSNCGFEWKAIIANRTRNHGCPRCAGKKAFDGYNDFASQNPELLKEWDYSKNSISPNSVSHKSDKKVWWICRICGFEWEATIKNRVGNKSGCPKCKKIYHTSIPEYIIFYYVSKVFTTSINGYKPKWLNQSEIDIFVPDISLGIEYDGKNWHKNKQKDIEKTTLLKKHSISLIRFREYGCPILNDASYIIPVEKTDGTYLNLEKPIIDMFEYISSQFNLSIPINIDLSKDLPEILSSFTNVINEKNIAYTFPELCKEWSPKNYPLLPEHVLPYSQISVLWKCSKCGYEWRALIGNRTSGHGCPKCAMKKRIQTTSNKNLRVGENSVSVLFPYLVKEYDPSNGDTLDNFTVGSSKTKKWICSTCGHHWSAPIAARCKGHGCPSCASRIKNKTRAQKKAQEGHSLKDTHPLLCEEWDYSLNTEIKPESITAGSKEQVWWKCSKCGFSWKATVNTRTHGAGCPLCANHIVAGVNDLASQEKEIMKDWDYSKNYLDPQKISSKSRKSVWWKCHICGNEWKQSVSKRKESIGCPLCADGK